MLQDYRKSGVEEEVIHNFQQLFSHLYFYTVIIFGYIQLLCILFFSLNICSSVFFMIDFIAIKWPHDISLNGCTKSD